MKLLFTVLILFSFLSFAEELTLNSSPEGAEVYVMTSQNQLMKIGKTPFKMPIRKIIKQFVKSNVFNIELQKDGFEKFRLLFSHSGSNDVVLNAKLEVSKEISLIQSFDGVMSDLFDAQRLIRGKSYAEAIEKLDQVSNKHPYFSIVHELKGSTFYLMKEYKDSLSYYRKAFSVNPKNRDAYIMKNYLEKKFKLKSI